MITLIVLLVAALSECDKKDIHRSYETTAVISTANQSDFITLSPEISTDRQAQEQTAVNEKTTVSEKNTDMIGLINDYRQSNGLKMLKISAELCDVAMTRAKESSVLWSHTRPNSEGLDTLLDEKNIRWNLAGENLARHKYSTDKAVVDAWMASESHRKIC